MKATRLFSLFFCILLLVTHAWGKRGAAPIVEPEFCGGMKYIAPNNDGIREYVEVWDLKVKKKISEVTIFTNFIQPALEKDVQWVFINKLQCGKGNLIITDERARQFQLDLNTRQITRIK